MAHVTRAQSPTPSAARGSRRDALAIGARRHPLVARTARVLRDLCRVPSGARVVLGVSGGADSIALLIACAALRERRRSNAYRVEPLVVHVHHHLRDAADEDERSVVAISEKFDVSVEVVHVHPAREAGNRLAAARRLRYEALARAASERRADFVATAHHADDQLETMLMALCRGTGLDGLGGMRWTRPLDRDITLVRPLLYERKSELILLCRAAGVEWHEDASNADLTRSRARLRAEVIPVLEALWPNAARRASASAELLATATQLLEREMLRTFGEASARSWPRETFRDLPRSLIAAGLRRAVLDAAPDAGDELTYQSVSAVVDAIRSSSRRPRQFRLATGVTAHVEARVIALREDGR